ncbi:hypothetical protein L1049_012043 [Liquidambar formosana]|uniref:Sulfotransferase n=1 Tax=Liquidambar formosana TaxID=63359 RepID=A0AAP0RSF2_LIQFO
MADTQPIRNQTPEDEEGLSKEMQELLLTLPKERGWANQYLYKYQGHWRHADTLQAVISAQRHFDACDTDLILLSFPKSGTTWLKALMFATVNRKRYTLAENPLLSANPHILVPLLEHIIYTNNQIPDLSIIPPPRLFASHTPYPLLPESIKTSNCKIVYICRNPLDNFISLWHFANKARPEHLGPLPIEEGFDKFCRGISSSGPFWDNVLGHWKISLENPHKVLFLKYEDLKEDIVSQLKSFAEFLGYPFSAQEESDGVIEEISRLCCFENLKELEINKTGRVRSFENKSFFRKATVGDWANYLTPSMAERLNNVVEEKLKGSGLSFNLF